MKSPSLLHITLVCGALLTSLAASAQVAAAPYTISVFATSRVPQVSRISKPGIPTPPQAWDAIRS